jgi:hypothetical protein
MISLPAWLDLGGGPSAAGDTEDSAAAAAPAPDEPDPHLQRYRDSIGLFDKWRVKMFLDLASEYDVGWTPRRSSAGSGLC